MGGILAGGGSTAYAYATSTTKAYTGDSITISISGDLLVSASSTPKSYAHAEGVTAGGIAVGVSIAWAESSPTVTAWIGASVNVVTGARLSGTPTVSIQNKSDGYDITAYLTGSPSLTFVGADDGLKDTITRSTGSWITDGFTAGQIILIMDAGENNGYYTIDSLTNSILTITVKDKLTDSVIAAASVEEVAVSNITSVLADMADEAKVTFTNGGATVRDTISRDTGSWLTEGFAVNQFIRVTNTTSNDGVYYIYGVTDTLMTVDAYNAVTDTTDLAGAQIQEIEAIPDKITRSTGSWISDGFGAGDEIQISGTKNNDGTYSISSVSALTITLTSYDQFVDETGTGYIITKANDTGGNITVSAVQNIPASGHSAYADAYGSGGSLIDVKAVDADAVKKNSTAGDFNQEVVAYLKNNGVYNATGEISVLATTNSNQYATGTAKHGGIAVGGAVLIDAGSDSETRAYLGDGISMVAGYLTVTAHGFDTNYAYSESGSGGLVDVYNAAEATTKNDSLTTVTLGNANGKEIEVGTLTLDALHSATYNSRTETLSVTVLDIASFYGGAKSTNNVNADVKVDMGSVDIIAYNIYIQAANESDKPWLSSDAYNVDSSSYSLVTAPGGDSVSTVEQSSTITLANGAAINQIGDPFDPGDFNVYAYNDIYGRDKVRLDAGGLIPVAKSRSQILANNVDAIITIGDADIAAVGDINMYTTTSIDLETNANTKSYGFAGAARGDSKVYADVENKVLIRNGARLYTEGGINLLAGRTPGWQTNEYLLNAYTDLYNWTVVPILSEHVKAKAELNQVNYIEIAAGSQLMTVKNVVLGTEKGFPIDVTGRGRGTDLYRETGEAIFGDEVSFDIETGDSISTDSTGVRVDGSIQVGIRNQVIINITGYIQVNADGSETPIITITSNTNSVTYTHGWELLNQNMQEELNYLKQLIVEYAGNTQAVASFQAEITRIRADLRDLGYVPTLYEADPTHDADDVCNNGEECIEIYDVAIPAYYITLGDIWAQSSDIIVEGDYLVGSGDMETSSDASITITNDGPFYLRVNRLTIPDGTGGNLNFKGENIVASSLEAFNTAINGKNKSGYTAGFDSIIAAGSGSEPQITITSSHVAVNGLGPDIDVVGDITNLNGTVTISALHGSLNVKISSTGEAVASIQAKTIKLTAGRDFVQGYSDRIISVGEPASIWSFLQDISESWQLDRSVAHTFGSTVIAAENDETLPANSSSIIAGNNVFISAAYLNINGIIQSGRPDKELTISNSAEMVLKILTCSADSCILINNADFVVRWNNLEDRLEVDPVKVEGGYMELSGQILSTGNGQINVMDGYGQITSQ